MLFFLVQASGPSSPMVMIKAWYTKIESSIIWLEDVLEGPMDIVDLLLHFNRSVKRNIGRGERAELLTKRSFSQMQGFECNWQLSVIKINELKPSCPQWQPREFCDFKIHVDVNRTIFHQNAFCFWCWLDLKAFLKSIELESKQETNSWSKKAKRQQKTLKINNTSFPPFFIYQQKQKGTKLYNFAIHSYNQAELLLGAITVPKGNPERGHGLCWKVCEALWASHCAPPLGVLLALICPTQTRNREKSWQGAKGFGLPGFISSLDGNTKK